MIGSNKILKAAAWPATLFCALLLTAACGPAPAGLPEARFREVLAEESRVDFANQLLPDESFNIIEYLYYYNGGGVAVGDVNNDGLPDLYFTANEGANALYLNRGGLRFEDVTERAGVGGMPGWSTGVTMADVNADGWLDIYVCRLGDYKGITGHNELWLNNRDGTFREAAAEYGLDFRGFATQAAFFDYDGDGDLDCYLLNHSVHSTENYGTSDIRERRDALAGDRLLANEDGVFTDVTATAGIYGSRIGYGLGIATGDLNGDGCPDLYISNDFHENDYLYYNNCDGTFHEAVAGSVAYSSTFSMGSDMADFDNDGRLDLISLDMKPADELVRKRSVGADPYNIYRFKLSFGYYYQFPRNMLQWNRGNLLGPEASFSEVGQLAGVDATDWSWAPLFCDLDNDGLKDLFISNGIWQRPNDLDYLKFSSDKQLQAEASDTELAGLMPPGQVTNHAFRNRGGLTFEDVTDDWGLTLIGCSTGAAYADLDRDGDLDLVLNNLNGPAAIYENRTERDTNKHFLRLRLRGGADNPFGIGARVTLSTGDAQQVQELYTTRGFQSAVEPVLTFGLGANATVETVEVRWPTGEVSRLNGVAADGEVVIDRTGGVQAASDLASLADPPSLLKRLPAGGPGFRHRENQHIDFESELLLPHMLSTKGPRMAVGDLDGDGRDDLYLCGARDQPGALYRQGLDGAFERMELRGDGRREEVDAVFFDADGDGDLDLYVVSGGGETFLLPALRRDQFWLNDGNGQFTEAADRLPPAMEADGACVVPLDYDGDGDLDLFVGSRSLPGYYGVAPDSYLLRNDGQGRFEEVTEQAAPGLRNLGMVADACLIRTGDARQLVVVGEWMPVTIFHIRDGQWRTERIPNSEGWWNAVYAADVDADGDADLLLGNLGLNADLRASGKEPVELFVKDFDDNRKVDPILTYYKNGRRYPYASFDELSMQLVRLKKDYRSYEAFAGETFDDIFSSPMLKGAAHLQARTFASGMMIREDKSWTFRPFPRTWQVSPLYAFTAADVNRDGLTDILAAGNFYESIPALGRYGASYGHLMLGKGAGAFEELELARSGFVVPGQARDMALIEVDGRRRVLVTRNDASVLSFDVADTPIEWLPR